MKRIISLCFLSAALSVLTVLSLVPHHHHLSAVCTVVELCEADHAYNDRHTAHDASGDQIEDEGCAAHGAYTPTRALTSVASPDALPLLAPEQAAPVAVSAPGAKGLQPEYGLYIFAYRAVTPNPGGGLRAPPSLS